MEENLEASTHWYYQKFYQDTEKGQLLSIRENLKNKPTTLAISDTTINQTLLFSINQKLKWAVAIACAILLKMFF